MNWPAFAARARAACCAGVGICAVPWLASSCTLLSEFDIHQCSEDAECLPSADASVRICESNRCVAGCRDNGQCQRAPHTTAGDFICPRRGAECVALQSEDCFGAWISDPQALPDRTGEGLALLGLFAPDLKSLEPSPVELTYRLALDELNDTGGLPGPGMGPVPVVGVLCNDESAAVTGAMSHLAHELGVRAVLAPLEPDALRAAVEGSASDVFFLDPLLDPGARVQRSENLWYLLGEQTSVAAAYAPLVRRLRALVGSQRQREPALLRVAVVYSSAPDADSDRRLQLAVEHELGFDAEARAALEQAQLLQRYPLAGADDLPAVAAAIAAAAPDILLLFASRNFASESRLERSAIVTEVESAWVGSSERPFYVLAPSNFEDDVITRGGERAEFRARLVGLNVHRALDPVLRDGLARRYEDSYRETRFAVSPNLYDGVYLLAYALAARSWLAQASGSSASVREGFRAITDRASQREVPVGPEGVDAAFELLRRAEPFALNGVTGPPDFDPETHNRPTTASPYCLVREARDGVEQVLWSVNQWVYAAAAGDFAWRDPEAAPSFCFDGLLP